MAAVTIEGVPEDITAGIDDDPRRRSDGKWAAAWVELFIDGDPQKILTPHEARMLGRRLLNLALEGDQITSSVRQ